VQAGRAREAVAIDERALQLAPEAAGVRYNLANALFASASSQRLPRVTKRSSAVSRIFIDARFNLAATLLRLNRVTGAIACYEDLLRARQTTPPRMPSSPTSSRTSIARRRPSRITRRRWRVRPTSRQREQLASCALSSVARTLMSPDGRQQNFSGEWVCAAARWPGLAIGGARASRFLRLTQQPARHRFVYDDVPAIADNPTIPICGPSRG